MPKRRSKRVQLRVHISVETPLHLSAAAETVTVSEHGAHIRLTSPGISFCAGERLRVILSDRHASHTAKVVWSGRDDAQYGIELDNPTPPWGVVFPALEDDGGKSEGVPSEPTGKQALTSGEPSTRPAAAAFRVCVMGLSAAHSPFSELSDLSLTSPNEATLHLKAPVDLGTALRIRGASGSSQAKVRVIGISRKREAGKWRVRVQFERPLTSATN